MSFDNPQDFFESTFGQIMSVLFLLLLFSLIILSGRHKNRGMKAYVISALLVALSSVLFLIPVFRMPQGGDVTLLAALPIVLCAYFFDTRTAVICGMCVGILQLIFNPFVIHPIQLILDYPFAFGAVGLSGIVFKIKKDALLSAYLFGSFCRYICAVLSGIIFFGSYVSEGINVVVWSLGYNFIYIAIEALIACAVISIPSVRSMFKRLKSELSD